MKLEIYVTEASVSGTFQASSNRTLYVVLLSSPQRGAQYEEIYMYAKDGVPVEGPLPYDGLPPDCKEAVDFCRKVYGMTFQFRNTPIK